MWCFFVAVNPAKVQARHLVSTSQNQRASQALCTSECKHPWSSVDPLRHSYDLPCHSRCQSLRFEAVAKTSLGLSVVRSLGVETHAQTNPCTDWNGLMMDVPDLHICRAFFANWRSMQYLRHTHIYIYILLYYIILYCIILYYILFYSILFYYIIFYYIILYYIIYMCVCLYIYINIYVCVCPHTSTFTLNFLQYL